MIEIQDNIKDPDKRHIRRACMFISEELIRYERVSIDISVSDTVITPHIYLKRKNAIAVGKEFVKHGYYAWISHDSITGEQLVISCDKPTDKDDVTSNLNNGKVSK